MKVAGVVILYNPSHKIYENILTYIKKLNILYIIDNSDNENYNLIKELKKDYNIKYIFNGSNKGVAYALNMAAKLAIKENCDWLLTMDQDSRADKDMLSIMYKFIDQNIDKKLGIVSPHHLNVLLNEKPLAKLGELKEEKVVMTSGNLLNLEAYKKVGKFKTKLFIDLVDYEYCLRLNHNKYKVITLNKAILYHKPGESRKVCGQYIHTRNYVRAYYAVRNTLYVLQKYKYKFPEWCTTTRKELLCDVIGNMVLCEDNRLKKLIYVIKGYIDYKLNIYGEVSLKI